MLRQLRHASAASYRQLSACFSSSAVDELLRYVRSPAAQVYTCRMPSLETLNRMVAGTRQADIPGHRVPSARNAY